MPVSFLSHLECALCGRQYDPDRLWNLCPECARPLLCRYHLKGAATALSSPDSMGDTLHLRPGYGHGSPDYISLEALAQREPTLW
ncbi:MAG: hypothetical protein ACP5JJ_07650, partial [Anaerolineae bacterium]